MLTYDQLYHPPDVEAAHEAWGASCGPCALAAVLKRPVMAMRPFLDGFETRGSMHPTHLMHALDAAKTAHHRLLPSIQTPPVYGVYFVQWTGPWLGPRMPVSAAYQHTHTVGVAVCQEYGLMIYDVNASNRTSPQGAWTPHAWWEQEVMPQTTATIPRADGGYYIRWACAVEVPHEPRFESFSTLGIPDRARL